MLVLLAVHLVVAMLAPAVVQRWNRRGFLLLALVPAAAFGWTLAQVGTIAAGGAVSENHQWVRQLHLDLALRMGRLPWLLALLVSGIGALVLVYCSRYFAPDEPRMGRFAGNFVGFAGAMFGLAISDNLVLLYIFWELTSILSFLLIGHDPQRHANRRAAGQALLVTTAGGLALLVGLVMLAQRAGTYQLSRILADPPGGPWTSAALLLILAGAISKSAIFPTSFWLPSAMVAPTPVSAYLHAAAMVKAGVFLVARLAPAFAHAPPWHPVTYVGGIITMIFGGWAALRQNDLKRLLAYGTVSQLGLLFVVTGVGSRQSALTGAAMLLAHALFKAPLFLLVGIIEHSTGTRDLRELSGVWRTLPAVFVLACLAGTSMAGLPPLLGFAAKEGVLETFAHGGPIDLALMVGLAVGTALTVAYTGRFLWGAFAGKAGVPRTPGHAPDALFLAAPGVLCLAGLALGIGYPPVDRTLNPARGAPAAYHLALWHGVTPALLLSIAAVAAGLLLFAFRDRVARAARVLRLPRDGDWCYAKAVDTLDRTAVEVTGATQRGSMPAYLATILVAVLALAGTAALAGLLHSGRVVFVNNAAEITGGLVVVAAALLAARARHRMTAMIFVGITGYGTAFFLVLRGAPDVALTQFLAETVSIVVFVLVLRRLPAYFSVRPRRRDQWLRRGLGVLVGTMVAVMGATATGARRAPSISTQFAPAAVALGGGRNVVNVTLVDIRAWDTLGEIAVLVVAATGVASLVFLRSRLGPRPRRALVPPPGAPPIIGPEAWLPGARALRPTQRSIIFEVITRLLFHLMVLYSLYLLFSGHNAPGGGFAGGLVVGLALVTRYLAGGWHELDEAAPVGAGLTLGAGLAVSVITAFGPLLVGGHTLQSATLDLHLPVFGDVHVITSIFFDIGVYLIVIGLFLDVLRSLGAEVDRQAEEADAREETVR